MDSSIPASKPVETSKKRPWMLKLIAGIVLVVLLAFLAIMWLWSREPAAFDISAKAQQRAGSAQVAQAPGYTTVSTLMQLTDILLHKQGGYLSNDNLPPGVLLDNMPNFEFGMLSQIRELSSALRYEFTRSQSQSVEDKALTTAQNKFATDSDRWVLPSAEGQYGEAGEQLGDFLARLADQDQTNAQFYARADNLDAYLRNVERQLGSLSQRLGASVRHERENTDLSNDPNAQQSTPVGATVTVKTPWTKIDDNFYEARGSAYALIHILRAVEIDFAPVLKAKNASASVKQIIRELEETQAGIWSPVILNGSGFGFLSNHSLIMANYVSRARGQIADLRLLLQRG